MVLQLFFACIMISNGLLFGAKPKSLVPQFVSQKAAKELKQPVLQNKKKPSGLRVKSLLAVLIAAACLTSQVTPVNAVPCNDILRALDDARVIHCKVSSFGLGWYACEKIRNCD